MRDLDHRDHQRGHRPAEQAVQPVSPLYSIAPGTVVLTPPSPAKLTRVMPEILVFDTRNDQIDAIEVGDILVGDRASKSPTGFLRRVKDVSHFGPGRGASVHTSNVELDQAVPQGQAAVSQTLDAGDVTAFRKKSLAAVEATSTTGTDLRATCEDVMP